MKANALLVLLLVALGAAVAPSVYGFKDFAAQPEGKRYVAFSVGFWSIHLRRLQEPPEEPPEEPPTQPTGDDNNNELPDNNNQPPDMGTYPQPMGGQQLMGGAQPMGGQQPMSEDDKEPFFPGGGFRGGCFPGSFNWPRCRSFGGGCFPGSFNWPRCRSFGGGRRCFPGGFDWPRCRRFGFSI
ncbi:hypothetical protein BBJ28_00021474 [Nothophytophthora sp. Chile5]|nr:hypothetical protein BBJ28_00021474 [Nothophytophthora sp. Chile5]